MRGVTLLCVLCLTAVFAQENSIQQDYPANIEGTAVEAIENPSEYYPVQGQPSPTSAVDNTIAPHQPPVPCHIFTNPASCVTFDHCGWCNSRNSSRCVEGSEAGPTHGTCHISYQWRTLTDQPCSYLHHCDLCTRSPVCGWCMGTLSCTDSNFKGLPLDEGSCDARLFVKSGCPAVPILTDF